MELNQAKIKLIIGLGNPDKQYENTYHNVGHLFIDQLENYTLNPIPYTLKSDVYMNESGKFVSKMAKKSGIKPENLLIAHDDSDILLGNYKISFDRSSAGHKGIESIIKSLGTQKFWRLRIGIRPLNADPADFRRTTQTIFKKSAKSASVREVRFRPRSPRLKAGEFVLKKISSANKKILEDVFRKAASELSQ